VRKDKKSKQLQSRFEVGTHVGCEARLFEFREKLLPDPHIVRIAAVSVDEALSYLRWHEPEFEVEGIQNFGVILMIYGSRLD
jgi:hypothetical protein